MIKLEHTDVTKFAALPRHPWYRHDFAQFEVLLNGEPITAPVVVDAENGYIKVYHPRGETQLRGRVHRKRPITRMIRRKGKVEIFRRRGSLLENG